MNNQSVGEMPADEQIKCAVEEGMENIFRTIFGENMRTSTEYVLCSIVESGKQMVQVETTSASQDSITASLPICHPDATCGGYRIDDVFFEVKANGWAETCSFEAWLEYNSYLGAKVVVRQLYPDQRERWLVADSIEEEVLYRGPFESLFPWAKKVVAAKWPHLSHVQSDTETAVMVLFMSRRAPDPPSVKN